MPASSPEIAVVEISPPPISELGEPSLVEALEKILRHNGMEDEVEEFLVQDAGQKGQGFASQTKRVKVIFKNLKSPELNLFVKLGIVQNPSHSKLLREAKLFEKESTFFMQYLPELRRFCEELGEEDLLEIYPTSYHGDRGMIVLEDLGDRGYFVLDKFERQDLDAASLAIKTLAKHHALSHAYMKEMGGASKFFERFANLDFEPIVEVPTRRVMLEPLIENGIRTNIQILERSTAEGKERAIQVLRGKIGRVWDDCILEAIKIDEDVDTALVLNHGDWWNNNMMFRKDPDGIGLAGPVAIDFQVTRYGSPAIDLGYFLYSSVKPEVRRGRLKDLFGVYLDTLNGTTERLGHPINLTFEALYESYRKKCLLGLWFPGILLATRAGFEVQKDIDMENIEMKDWGEVLTNLIQRWIQENGESCEEDAKGIVELVKEFEELCGN